MLESPLSSMLFSRASNTTLGKPLYYHILNHEECHSLHYPPPPSTIVLPKKERPDTTHRAPETPELIKKVTPHKEVTRRNTNKNIRGTPHPSQARKPTPDNQHRTTKVDLAPNGCSLYVYPERPPQHTPYTGGNSQAAPG